MFLTLSVVSAALGVSCLGTLKPTQRCAGLHPLGTHTVVGILTVIVIGAGLSGRLFGLADAAGVAIVTICAVASGSARSTCRRPGNAQVGCGGRIAIAVEVAQG